ncbi:hypothetical protein [Ferdinandcohnia sp. Marseille-Q9671]
MDIPTILSGPILRRVEPSHIYIWVALSKRYKISAKLYQIEHTNGTDYAYHELKSISEATTIRVGKKLFLSLIKISPQENEFPSNSLLGYNLLFHKNSEIFDLHDFGLLTKDEKSITYGDLEFPSFYISTQEQSNILYGSCRKLHGKGEDALSQGDTTLETHYLDLEKRPSSLFLMGDQIYADDVPDPIFPIMHHAGKRLIGRRENLAYLEPRLKENSFLNSIHQIRGRQYIMEKFSKFTSAHSHNHAMTLGEYAALYLLSWSPELWNYYLDGKEFPSFEERIQKKEIYLIHEDISVQKKRREKEVAVHESRYNEQLVDVKETYETLTSVRRLLANIPTYMIFDDHDITDDWNISHDWKQNVFQSNLGRHIIANGLAAYWLFQGWGNDPEAFDHSFLRKMAKYFSTYDTTSISHNNWEKEMWKFNRWNFVAPVKPKAIFLDTRTQRKYDHTPLPVSLGRNIEEKDRPPQLIGKQGWQTITTCLFASGWNRGEQLLVVSPAPVYGIGLIESFLTEYIYPLRTIGVPVTTAFDFESWKYNGEGFSELLYQIKAWGPSDCLILSGDVHYAFTITTNIEFPDGENLRLHQFTSSPMNNMSFSGLQGGLMKAIVTINAAKRRNKEINRYCTETYDIVKEDKDHPCPTKFTWKEKIRYLSSSQGPIIETENNLGHLTLTPTSADNALLKNKHTLSFNQIPLN